MDAKRLSFLSAIVAMLFFADGFPQGVGQISMYIDEAGTQCGYPGQPAGFIPVYIYHEFHDGVTGSRFRIQQNETNWTWFIDQPRLVDVLITGDTDTGVTLTYSACVTTRFNPITVFYEVPGTAAPCATLEIVAAPTSLSGEVESTDCNSLQYSTDTSGITMNPPDANCFCEELPATERSTWGKIKALYR